ncbi:DNA-binding response regulator [Candidatus Saccharibacteria bacterium]|nr:MAG: DNA-binding response regulator [Candidatus Saccharibacteria bacterium]
MRILVVEDEVKIATSLQRGIEAEGYVVDVAYDGDQADVLVDATEYDLVILDWMIPGQHDGPGLIAKWRGVGNQTPILMLTAKSTIGDRVAGLDTGADDYLSKPFSFDELLARVRALLRRPKAHTGNELQSGPLQVDVVSKKVIVDGKQVHVTAKEFQLLEYLLRHVGEVVSKERILTHVWSDEDRVQANTVETFIGHLRKKLRPHDKLIVTVRGYGYRIG